MDVISSRFQKALVQRLAEAHAEKTKALAMGMAPTFDEYKRQCGVLQGYNEVAQMIEEIETALNAENRG